MHRVAELADRVDASVPATAGKVRSFVPLAEILSELRGVGPKSKTVGRTRDALLGELGPELDILGTIPTADIGHRGGELLREAVERLRSGNVIRSAGYDGEYGVIRLFADDELEAKRGAGLLFALPTASSTPDATTAPVQTATAPVPQPGEAITAAAPLAEHGSVADRPGRLDADDAGRPSASERTLPLFGGVSPSDSGDLLAALDPDQRAAAEIHHGPLLIVAGPGSGKTRTLTHRIAHLVDHHGIPPAECLAITFTRRAADEMSQRLGRLLPTAARDVPVTTFHSLGLSIIRDHCSRVGLGPTFRVADSAEQAALLSAELKVTPRQAAQVLRRISRARRSDSLDDDEQLRQAVTAYRRALRARERIDFDDLVGLAVEILEADSQVAQAYQRRFRYLSIDEYQDVDATQYRLVRALVSQDGNVCAIGDPDQAIYGFRGADVAFFRRFREDFPGATVIQLERNYRSGRPIVQASQQVIMGANRGGQVTTSSSEGDRVMVMRAVQRAGDQLTVHQARSDRAEAEFVVATIEQLLGGHSFFSVDSGRSDGVEEESLSFSDIAVLYRTESQADPVREALERSGMPYRCRSHDALTAQPGVPELVEHMLTSDASGSVHQRLRAASSALRRVQEEAASGAEIAPQDAPIDGQCLHRALELLTPLAKQCGTDAERFATELTLGAQVDSWDPRADRLSLLTLHAAKGLEFPVVFVVGCEDGLLPLRFGPTDRDDLEEERRLFYVGMTRAQRRLFLCHASKRQWRGKVRPAEPSPFLLAIEQQLVIQSKTRAAPKSALPDSDQLKLF
jgi:DNA helicase-2/ATP-dependent DNA helicase PcrA